MADPNQIEQQALLNKMLEQANRLGSEYSDILSSQHDIMSSMFEMNSGSLDNQQNSVSNLQNAVDSLTKSNNTSKKSFDDQDRALKELSGTSNATANNVQKLGEKLIKAGQSYNAISSLAKSFRLMGTAAKGALSILTTLAGSIFRLGLSLLTLPIGIINDLFAEAQQGGGSNEFRRTLEDIRKQFGDLSKNESKAVIDSFRNIRGELANTGLSSYRILGNMAERLKFVFETAQHMGVAFGLVRQQLVRNAEAVAAYIKGLGLTEEGQKALANRAAATGTSITEIGRQMTSYAYQVGEAFGLNGKQISRDVGNMMGDIDNFGNMSIQTLTNVAVYARKLGVEVKSLTKVIGAFDNFDKAAESVAQLSQAFGLQLDTFALVQEQDPAARIEQLRKAFFGAGKSIESMTRQERALLATQTGLDQETLALVFSQKSASTSYADIQRKSEQARKHQLTQAEAMEKLSNSIERLVKDGQSLQGGLFDILFAGFAAGVRRTGPFRHMMMEIRRLMREVFRVGREMGRMFVELFPGVKQLFQSIGTYLSPRGIGRNFQQLKQQFREFLTGLTPQNAGRKFTAFIESVRRNFQSTLSGPGLNGIRQALTTIGAVISSIVSHMVRYVGNGVAEAFRSAAAFIRNPQEFLRNLRQGASTAGNGLMTALAPLIDSIIETAPVVWEAFKELLSAAFDRLKTWVVGFAREHWMGLLGVLFAPSLISAVLSSLAGVVGNALVNGAGGIFSGAIGRIGNLARGGGAGGIGQALDGVAQTVSGAGTVGEAVQNSRSLSNPAAIGKMVAAAAIISVGIFAITQAIVYLSEQIRARKLSASDVGMAVLTMGGAVAIMTAIGAAMPILARAGEAIQSNARGVVAAIVAVGLVGAGLAAGMYGLLRLFSGVNITQVQGVALAMSTALLVFGQVGLAVAALALGGSLVTGAAGPIAAGVVAIGLVGTAIAFGMRGLISLFSGVSESSIRKVGLAMSTALSVVGNIAMSAIILAGVGAAFLGPQALVIGAAIAAGMAAVVVIAGGLKLGMTAITNSMRQISIGPILSANVKIRAIASLVGTIAAMGVGLAAAATPLGLVAGLSSVIFMALKKLSEGMFSAVSGLLQKINSLPSGGEVQGKVTIFTSIIRTIIDFGRTVGELLQNGSIFEGIGTRVRAINSLVYNLTTQIGTTVKKFIEQASALPDVTAIQPKVQVITGIMTAFGTLARSVTNAGTRDEDAISALQSFSTNVFSSLTNFAQRALPQITNLVSTIAGNSVLNSVDVNVVNAFGSIISTVLGSLGSVIRSIGSIFTRQGSIIGDADDIATSAPALGRAIGSVVSGLFGNANLFESINQFIAGIASSVGNIAASDVQKISTIGTILGPLFNAISAVSIATSQIGQQAVRGDAGAMDRLKQTISAVAGGISTEFGNLVTNLVATLGRIDPRALQVVKASSVVLRGLFENINQMFSAISSFGGENNANASANAQNAFRGIYEALFGTKGNQWSLRAFVDVFGPNRGESAALMAGLTNNMGTITTLSQKIGEYKQNIQTIFGAVDEQFNNSLSRGLNSTLEHVNSTVQEIIRNINEVHEQINQVGRSININAALANLGETIGTASPERLQIARGDLTINITVHVTMDVDELEESIATRAQGSTFVVSEDAVQRNPALRSAHPTYSGG